MAVILWPQIHPAQAPYLLFIWGDPDWLGATLTEKGSASVASSQENLFQLFLLQHFNLGFSPYCFVNNLC